jgi:hypothetical protein
MEGGHWPLHVAAVGVDRAGVSASPDDHELGGLHNFVGEGFGELRDHRDTDPVQDLTTIGSTCSDGHEASIFGGDLCPSPPGRQSA